MRQIRQGGSVLRWHTIPPVRNQSVGEHSWGVAVLCAKLWENCSKNLLLAALYHDVSEAHLGDNPAPIKWKHPKLAQALADVEHDLINEMGLWIALDDDDKKRLKIADMMELLWFCIEEERRGNRTFKEIFVRGVKYLQDTALDENSKTMLNELIAMEADL